ncbi:MAG TPA: sigma-54 dependent transcriptional regulator [Polyangiaceae bacterium]|jgi:DNA-binding NtrC family response regulator|nr:sigma-54 dependent transcriptional regulator [Polyangiaceae bacterium]
MNNVLKEDPPLVAIVDSDVQLAEAQARSLSPLGFKALAFNDGSALNEGLSQGRIAAVILDLQVRSTAGWELLEHLRTRHPDVVVIVQSSSIDVASAVSAMRGGAFDVLEKPVRVTELQTRILEGLLHKRSKGGSAPRPLGGATHANTAVVAREGLSRLLGNSAAIARVREQVRGIARFSEVSTLIIGETGTGKEVVAEALHALSSPDKPFVTVNCAAIPDSLFESELFGHEAGSFTGARNAKPGLFETVGEGTLLLDEVGEMAMSMQPKLLRVLQNRTFRRVGGARDIELKARIVSATNRKLSAERQDGMRSDLYFRLAGFTIVLPPLRHRLDDIDLLANHFLLDFANRYPGIPTRISRTAAELMLSHPWRGNVRELKRVVEQAAVLSGGSVLDEQALSQAIDERRGSSRALTVANATSGNYAKLDAQLGLNDEPPSNDVSVAENGRAASPRAVVGAASGTFPIGLSDQLGLNELQQKLILETYEANAHNLTRAARALRIPRTTLRDRLKRYGCL